MMMELELGLALPSARPAPGSCGKRGFGEAFGVKATLPLFVREDGDGRGGGDGAGAGDWEMSVKRKKLVGWPPVKCAHRRNGGGYVKVKMEGVAIGRKVDLSLHSSYEELLDTLGRMFPSTNQDAREERNQDEHHRRRHPYAVTYEDGDGDWMLVGDVPWEAFAKSVKRLKILV